MSKLFGTDGIRGIANRDLSPRLAMQVGTALAGVLIQHCGKGAQVVVGRDTRISSTMLEYAVATGLASGGVDVKILGVVPTPLVAYMCKYGGYCAGVMISASHNSFEYNGIKIFGSGGLKLSDEAEQQIEDIVLGNISAGSVPDGSGVGSISKLADPVMPYIEHLSQQVYIKPKSNLRVLADCANGSTYSTAKKLFKRLGIQADYVADTPDGININASCGSTHIERLSKLVVEGRYDIAVAFDGDGDRCLAVDEKGNIIDGDIMLAIFASNMKAEQKLSENAVVVTVMSNYGFDAFAERTGISAIKTKVGDRYVLEAMLQKNISLGGEQSGHIIFSECMTTGDGELTAVKLIEIMAGTDRPLSELARVIDIYPQVLVNVSATPNMKQNLTESVEFNRLVRECENQLEGSGRILIRPSGTEPLIRIMVEGKSNAEIQAIANRLAAAAKAMLV